MTEFFETPAFQAGRAAYNKHSRECPYTKGTVDHVLFWWGWYHHFKW